MTAQDSDFPAEVFTHAEARAAGISDRSLSQMRADGRLDRIARGIYARPGLEADRDLVEVAIRAPEATLCLTSALAIHDLTDEVPPRIDVALPRPHRQPVTGAPVTWHRFDPDTFELGRSTIPVTGEVSIGVYGPTRTVVDAYRLRHLYGTDQALGALKRWMRIPGSHPSDLMEMAIPFPSAAPAIRLALEILL